MCVCLILNPGHIEKLVPTASLPIQSKLCNRFNQQLIENQHYKEVTLMFGLRYIFHHLHYAEVVLLDLKITRFHDDI